MKGLRHSLGPVFAAVALAGVLRAQTAGASAPTNLRIYQTLAGSLGDSLAALIPASDTPRVNVHVAPADVAWFLQGDVERAFSARRCDVRTGDSARYDAGLGATVMRVRYTNLRRSWMFGPHLVDRSVTLTARTRLADRLEGRVLESGEHTASFTDTVAVDAVQDLEQAAIPVTKGVLPGEDFFSGIAEPLVVVGAVAVAIFLLFTVRS
ncbi:MAG TPA: hypothetical protein VL221_15175 [Bacteroidota bacterium]|nr:hypothetical protein [Bacteroidota bacterium]